MSEPASSARYLLITKLGQGGMARVTLALSRGRAGVNKLVVRKELLPALMEDPDLYEMFLDEARLSVRLNHPNVVQTYEVSTEDEHPVIIMEYLEGQSLMALLHRVGRRDMPMDLHLYILTQVLAGLHYAHELCDLDGTPLSVVHRDVSPQNVFVTYDGQVKLVDFGIAKAARSNRRTHTGVFKGKVTYAAPEQVTGSPVDRRCDIFAFGVMLWEALARCRLSMQEIDMVLMQQRANGADPRIETVAPDTPEELVRICNKAMAKDPADRYATADELRKDLLAELGRSTMSSSQELGEIVRSSFLEERSAIRRVIESRTKDASFDDAPSRPAIVPPLAPPAPISYSSAASRSDDTRKESEGSTAKVASLTPPLPKKGLSLEGRFLIGSLVLGAVVLTIAQVSHHPAGDGAAVEPSAHAALAAAPANTAPTVLLAVRVDPPEGRVYLDDVELGENPYHGAMPRGPASHHLRASAPGFVTEERSVVFDTDLRLRIQLRPASAGSATPAMSAFPARHPQQPR